MLTIDVRLNSGCSEDRINPADRDPFTLDEEKGCKSLSGSSVGGEGVRRSVCQK